MAKFFESNANRARFFAVVEEGSELGFSRTGEDSAHDLAENTDGTLQKRRGSVWTGSLVGMRWPAAEVMITSGARAGFGG